MLSKVETNLESTRPDVSVVVASFSGPKMLEQCLKSIAAQEGNPEVIVATNISVEETVDVKKRFAKFRFIHEPPDTDVFQLRTIGVLNANGKLIVLTEDHCIAESRWLSTLLKAYRETNGPFIGGSVDYGGHRGLRDWSLFLCEYAKFIPTKSTAAATTHSGVNVAYDRNMLQSCRETWQSGLYENEVHDDLIQSGYQFRYENDARVSSHLKMSFTQATAHLFTGGSRFGRYRQSWSTPLQRVFWLATSMAIPIVLTLRIIQQVMVRQPKRLVHLVASTPFLVSLLAAWSLGEAIGLVRATAGIRIEQPTKDGCNANWC